MPAATRWRSVSRAPLDGLDAIGGPLVERAVDVEDRVVATLAQLKPGRALYADVEHCAGVVMDTSRDRVWHGAPTLPGQR
jgi:hypothetical protein